MVSVPDENRFEGLDEALGGDADEATETSDDQDDGEPETPRSDSGETSGTDSTTAETQPGEGAGPGGPAFQFDATEATTLYARPAAWESLDDVFFAARAELRERGTRDVEKRELHDALLRAADPDDIADAVETARE